MKLEWKKDEKALYLPPAKPRLVDVPAFQFLCVSGTGNPNKPEFARYIEALFSVSWAIKMGYKKEPQLPPGYTDYTVYPLEGVWDIAEHAREAATAAAASAGAGTGAGLPAGFDKDDLVFTLMIRQPAFVSADYAAEKIDLTANKTGNDLVAQLKLEVLAEGCCVQCMHIGPYDDEPATFAAMEAFAAEQSLTRELKIHREIYISDFRRTAPEKLKTVLRFKVR